MQSKSDTEAQKSNLTERILYANPLNYNFFDDPDKNKYARAYLDSYKIVLKSTGCDHARAIKLFQPAWDEWSGGRGENCKIRIEDITNALGNPEKAASKIQYHTDKASHSGPLTRILYKVGQGFAWLKEKILPKSLYNKNVDVSADIKNSAKKVLLPTG